MYRLWKYFSENYSILKKNSEMGGGIESPKHPLIYNIKHKINKLIYFKYLLM